MSQNEARRLAVKHFLARQIAKQHGKVDTEELAEAISEIEVETQTSGSPFIKVHLADPYWRLLSSGFIDLERASVNVGGGTRQLPTKLRNIEVEFPEDSGWMWTIAAVETTNDLTQPNLILTFEDSIVVAMREVWGFKIVPPNAQTRAQFVASQIKEVNLHLKKQGKPAIRAVIPSENELQEVEENPEEKIETATGKTETGQTALTPKDKQNAHGQVNKAPQIGKGAKLTVKGQPMTSEQEQVANELLQVLNAAKAPLVCAEAMFYAAIGESGITRNDTSAPYWGVLSGSRENFPDAPNETKQLAESFLEGGRGFAPEPGGALMLAHGGINNPEQIAVEVEKPSIWPANSYATEVGSEQFLPEAQAIVDAGGGVRGSLLHGSGSTTGSSDVAQLSRGTNQNPDEDTWECIQRLAADVRWYAFTSGLSLPEARRHGEPAPPPPYKRGRYFYYMDAADFIRQKPAAYLNIVANTITNAHTGKKTDGAVTDGMVGTWDDTTYEHQTTHKVKGKQQSKANISKPASPSELRLPVVCDPLEYESGDVIVVQGSGTFDGRWVVVDTLRNYIMDPFTTLTLEPPLLPYPEPFLSSSSLLGRVTGLYGVVEYAEKAFAEKGKYEYSEGSDRENGGTLFGPAPRTMDCSAFATLCYKEAHLPDPSAQNYSPIGNTTSMIAHMVKTSNPVPGDLIFYGSNEKEPAHVVIYIGNGNGIGMEDKEVGIVEGPVWGPGNLGEGAGLPIGGAGHAWRLSGQYSAELHKG